MKTDIRKQDIDVTWQNLNPGTVVTGGATAPEFNTGEWRVNVPVLDKDKCKQCLMCVPVCPDSSIPVKNQKREDFDLMHCKGCGICAKVCPFGAITMKEGDE